MLFGDSCVACAGLGAALDAKGVCTCGAFATLVDDATDSTAVCECNTNFLPFKDDCVMCSGIGAFVNEAGQCSCGTGATLEVIDNLVQCVCQTSLIQSSDVCFQCDGGKISVHNLFIHVNRSTGKRCLHL